MRSMAAEMISAILHRRSAAERRRPGSLALAFNEDNRYCLGSIESWEVACTGVDFVMIVLCVG